MQKAMHLVEDARSHATYKRRWWGSAWSGAPRSAAALLHNACAASWNTLDHVSGHLT